MHSQQQREAVRPVHQRDQSGSLAGHDVDRYVERSDVGGPRHAVADKFRQ